MILSQFSLWLHSYQNDFMSVSHIYKCFHKLLCKLLQTCDLRISLFKMLCLTFYHLSLSDSNFSNRLIHCLDFTQSVCANWLFIWFHTGKSRVHLFWVFGGSVTLFCKCIVRIANINGSEHSADNKASLTQHNLHSSTFQDVQHFPIFLSMSMSIL